MIEIKSKEEIKKIKESCAILAETLEYLKKNIFEGMSTLDIDNLAREKIESSNAKPAFLNYHGFPATACVSINEEVIHGIPNNKRKIKEGDLVSVDLGAIYKDFYSDAAFTLGIGKIKDEDQKLLDVTEKALYKGIKILKDGIYLGDLSSAIGNYVAENKMSVVREFTGHGIGRNLHEEPSIPNFGKPKTGPILREGMTVAIEPMVCLGKEKVKFLSDGWTVVTLDGKKSAHFEHTVLITKNGAEILTKHNN